MENVDEAQDLMDNSGLFILRWRFPFVKGMRVELKERNSESKATCLNSSLLWIGQVIQSEKKVAERERHAHKH